MGYILDDFQNSNEYISDQITILDKNYSCNLILVKRISGFTDKVELIELYNCCDIKDIEDKSAIISEVIPEKDSVKSGRIDIANKEIIILLNSTKNIVIKYVNDI